MTLFNSLERLTNLQMVGFWRNPRLKGLPAVQIQILYYLARCNHYSNTPGAVTEYLGLTRGTVSQSLGKLAQGGWIIREGDAHDKRIVRLSLSPQGREAIASALDEACLERAQSALPDGGAALQEQLLTLLKVLQTQQGAKIFGECRHCRYHQQRQGEPFCGLTQQPLPAAGVTLICREFTAPA